jgi:hypothetical protein
MSEFENSSQGGTENSGGAATATEGSGAATTSAQQQAQTPTGQASAPTQDDFYRVHKGQLAAWNGNVPEALRRAKAYDQLEQEGALGFYSQLAEQGVTGTEQQSLLQTIQWLKSQGLTPSQFFASLQDSVSGNGNQDGYQPDDSSRPLTVEEYRRIQAEEREAAKQASEKETMSKRWADEDAAVGKVLTESGIKDDSPHRKAMHTLMRQYFIPQTLEADIPPHIKGETRRKMLNVPATESQIAQATETMKAFLKDFSNTAVSDYAAGQKNIPGATLGSGPGGKTPKKKFSELSAEERYAVMAGKVPEGDYQPG